MKTPILILHGWGKNMTGQKYNELAQILRAKGYEVFTPDLPGFGKNPLPKEALEFEDYIAFVKEFIEKKINKKVIVAGHSFGGRIAIRLCAKYPALFEKLILLDASGIPQKLSFKKKLAFFIAKVIGPFFHIPPFSYVYSFFRKILYRSIGEMDYHNAGALAETFKKVYRVSIVDDLPRIKAKTLILWGGEDTFTPISDGEYMHAQIPDNDFVIIPKASHRLPYENPEVVGSKIISFLS